MPLPRLPASPARQEPPALLRPACLEPLFVAVIAARIAAGADAIMIHSKEKSPDEVQSFLSAYSRLETKVPVVTVPTTYNAITEEELYAAGSSVVIYANHLLRAAYPAMTAVAESILTNSRSQEADSTLLPVKTIINMIQDNSGR